MADIDVGAISEALNNKADRDLVNSTPPYLKTTYVNGTSGYSIWSNGYCEQWGRVPAPEGVQSVNLLKTFADTNYHVLAVNGYMDTANRRWASAWVKTVDTIVVMSSLSSTGASSAQLMWKASGYLADGQY